MRARLSNTLNAPWSDDGIPGLEVAQLAVIGSLLGSNAIPIYAICVRTVSRAEAQFCRLKVFDGAAGANKCGSAKRFTSNRHCVNPGKHAAVEHTSAPTKPSASAARSSAPGRKRRKPVPRSVSRTLGDAQRNVRGTEPPCAAPRRTPGAKAALGPRVQRG